MKKNLAIGLSMLIFLHSCTYGNYASSQYTPITESNCEQKASDMHLFFKDEPLDFKYYKIGLVEAQAGQFSRNSLVLDYLKNEAWQNCANAIIHLDDDFRLRESGYLFEDEEDEDLYDAKVYKGIAVYIEKDSAFYEKYGKGTTMSFTETVNQDLSVQEKNSKTAVAVVLISMGFAGILYMLFTNDVAEESY